MKKLFKPKIILNFQRILLLVFLLPNIILANEYNGLRFFDKDFSHCLQSLQDSTKTPIIKKSDFGITGGASIFSSVYSSTRSDVTASPFNYGVSLSTTLKFREFSYPFTFSYSANKVNITHPFLRIGLAPSYKWVKIYLGNQSLNYNRYVFGGLNAFGAGFEIKPKWFYLSAFYGNMASKIFVDSTSVNYKSVQPRFDTKGIAAKIGIKSNKISLLFSYFSGSDDEKSLAYINPLFRLKPRKNKAIGAELYLRVTQRISLNSMAGISIFTRDIKAGNIDSLLLASHVDPLPSWSKILETTPNTSSQIYYGYDNSLQYNDDIFGLVLRYKKVMPEFKTLGIRFNANDVIQYSFEPSLKLWGGKVTTELVVGVQHNNLLSKSSVETSNKIMDATLSIVPNEKLFINANYSNYGIKTSSSSTFTDDSISIRNVSSNYAIMGMYMLAKDRNVTKTLNVNFNRQMTTEQYEYSQYNNSDFNSTAMSTSFNISNAIGNSYNTGLNYSKYNTVISKIDNKILDIQSYGVFAGISRKIGNNVQNKKGITASLNGNLNFTGLSSDAKKIAFGTSLNFSFQISKKLNLNLSYNYSSSTIKQITISQNYVNANLNTSF